MGGQPLNVGVKRPLERASLGEASRETSTTSSSTFKKARTSLVKNDHFLSRAKDVCTTMLPDSNSRKITLDQAVFAKGNIERLHYDEKNEAIFFFLESSTLTSNDYAELPIVLRGPWVHHVFKQGGLREHAQAVVAFKEAQLAKKASQTTPGSVGDLVSCFDYHLLFDRGIECWVSDFQASSATPGATYKPAVPEWKHVRLFVPASKPSAPVQPQSESVTTLLPVTARDLPGQKSIVAGSSRAQYLRQRAVERIPVASDLLPQPQEARIKVEHHSNQYQIPTIATLQDSAEALFATHATKKEDPVKPKSLLPSPPTGVTQVESGQLHEPCTFDGEFEEGIALRTNESIYNTVIKLRHYGIEDQAVSVIGVAVHGSEDAHNATGGQYITIRLIDPSVASKEPDTWYDGRWLGVTYLDGHEHDFPRLKRGDVIMIRQAQTRFYDSYYRLNIFPDHLCDWVKLATESFDGIPSPQYADLLPVEAFQTGRGSARPNRAERDYMQKLMIWVKGNMQEVPENLQDTLSQVRPGPDGKDGDLFNCTVTLVRQPQIGNDRITLFVTDYTSNRRLASPASTVPGKELGEKMEMKAMLWKNEAQEEALANIAQLVQAENPVLHFNGLRARTYMNTINANGRINKPEFSVQALQATDERYISLTRRRDRYRQEQASLTEESTAQREWQSPAASRAPGSLKPPKQEKATTSQSEVPAIAPVVTNIVAQVPEAQLVINKVQDLSSTSFKMLKSLASLRPPAGPYDRNAFFDCVCEVVHDVGREPFLVRTDLDVTDYTENEQFWLNMNNMDYPQRKVIMHIAVYGNQNRNKIEALRQGQRVMLSNLRAKLDKQGNLEAHVGENSSFQVAILPDQSAQYMVLDTNRKALLEQCILGANKEGISLGDTQEDPNNPFDGVACKFAGCRVDDAVFSTPDDARECSLRLRGRVLATSPQAIDDFLLVKCNNCKRYLSRDEALCRECEDGVLGDGVTRQWCFSLQIEVEPQDCDISRDPVEPARAFWVGVVEREGGTVFMNGLEPNEASLPEARRLLKEIIDNPSANNGTNVLFDFCVRKSKGQSVLLMCDTALKREGKKLPWV